MKYPRCYFFLFLLLTQVAYLSGRQPDKEQLALLEQRVKDDLMLLNHPGRAWVMNENPQLLDVAIVGGGTAGMTAAFALQKLGITHLQLFDENPEGQEGPWRTYAKMLKLRSGKKLAGPVLGLPSLTFQAWYKAQYGNARWDRMDKIPTTLWADYLDWFRKMLNLPTRNKSKLLKIIPVDDTFHLVFNINGQEEVVLARKVVLATGRGGCGGLAFPSFCKDIPRHFYAHSNEPIDFESIRGKSIVVIGVGAAALDITAVALEHGAAKVDVLVRREAIPKVNKFAFYFLAGPGLGFYSLDDANRVAFMGETFDAGVPPPRNALARLKAHSNVSIRLNTFVESCSVINDQLEIQTNNGTIHADFILAGTGFDVNPYHQPELAPFADEIFLWKDRVQKINPKLEMFPYLGRNFEFIEKNPGNAPFLKNLHCFNFGAFLSHGLLSGEIAGISWGAQRLAEGIAMDFFVQERQEQFQFLKTFGDVPGSKGDIMSNETILTDFENEVENNECFDFIFE